MRCAKDQKAFVTSNLSPKIKKLWSQMA